MTTDNIFGSNKETSILWIGQVPEKKKSLQKSPGLAAISENLTHVSFVEQR